MYHIYKDLAENVLWILEGALHWFKRLELQKLFIRLVV